MAGEPPAICRRIRRLRDSLKEQFGSDFSQESVARRVGISLKAYRAYESFREPRGERLKQIAVALGQDEDYFSRADVTEEVRQVVREELRAVLASLARLEAALSAEEPPRRDDERP